MSVKIKKKKGRKEERITPEILLEEEIDENIIWNAVLKLAITESHIHGFGRLCIKAIHITKIICSFIAILAVIKITNYKIHCEILMDPELSG